MHILRLAVFVAIMIASTAAIAQRGRRVDSEQGPSCTTITSQELNNTGLKTVADTVGNLPTAPGGAAPSKPACTPPTPSAAAPQPGQPVQPVQPTPAASAGKTASDVKPEPPRSAPNGLDDRLSEAEQKLDGDIKACKPINPDDYKPLFEEADNNFKMAVQASNANVPVDKEKMISEHRRAISVYQRARAAAAKQSTDCPPKALPKITEKTTSDQHSSVTPVQPLKPFNQRILDIHNAERTAVGVPELRWNMQLAMDATGYAQQLARTGQLVHAPREGRGIERENLQQGLIGSSPDRMMQSWTTEKDDFVAGYYPNVARDANWVNVSHYTQMIWPTTTDIGCGAAEGRGFLWLDCRYSPGGNKDGKPVGLPPQIASSPPQPGQEPLRQEAGNQPIRHAAAKGASVGPTREGPASVPPQQPAAVSHDASTTPNFSTKRRVAFCGHMWIIVDTYDNQGKKTGELSLHFSPSGYEINPTSQDAYPKGFAIAVDSTRDADQRLVEMWRYQIAHQAELLHLPVLGPWSPGNNCWTQSLWWAWYGIEPNEPVHDRDGWPSDCTVSPAPDWAEKTRRLHKAWDKADTVAGHLSVVGQFMGEAFRSAKDICVGSGGD